jgi:tetratricopeptide (TPR) repeat protein
MKARINSTESSPPLRLNADERLLYHEQLKNSGFTPFGIALALFLFFGFPAYGCVIFTVAGSLLAGISFHDQWQLIEAPLMLIAAGVVALVVIWCVGRALPEKASPRQMHLVVTDKRIYTVFTRRDEASGLIEEDPRPLFYETPFSEVKLITIPEYGKNRYISFQLEKRDNCVVDDENEKDTHIYSVPDAQKVYSKLPLELRQARGLNTKAGIEHKAAQKRHQIFAQIVMLIVAIMLVMLSRAIVLQEVGLNYLRAGRDEYLHHHYERAESLCRSAETTLAKTEPNSHYGPACYRLALALNKNGKFDEAIPFFIEATQRCNYHDCESHSNWQPAIPRSYCYLAEIYAKRGDNTNAARYFELAREHMAKETQKKHAKHLVKSAASFYRTQGDEAKADQIEDAGRAYKPLTHNYDTFRQ